MDYKSFDLKFEEIKNKIYNYIDEKRTKNINRGDEIYNTYVQAIRSGDFSLKSFKAKIIHNELEHKKTALEFKNLSQEQKQNLEQLFAESFQDYILEANEKITSPTKSSDLATYNATARRKRQDVINRINSLEKEYTSKKKDEEASFKEHFQAYKDSINESNRRLGLDLQRINDSSLAEYGDLERNLLEIDDVAQIKQIKLQIKTIRLKALEEQKNIKEHYAKEQLELKDKFIELTEKYNMNSVIQDHSVQIKKLEHNLQKKTIDFEIAQTSFMYDCEYEKKHHEVLKQYRYDFLKTVTEHNKYVQLLEKSPQQQYAFAICFMEGSLYYLITKVLEINPNDNIYKSLTRLLDYVKLIDSSYKETLKLLDESCKDKINGMKQLFEEVPYGPENEKRHHKEDLIENVITSLNRYYENIKVEATEMVNILIDMAFIAVNAFSKAITKNESVIPFYDNTILIKYCHKLIAPYNQYGYIAIGNKQEKQELANMNESSSATEVLLFKKNTDSKYHAAIKAVDTQIAEYKLRSTNNLNALKSKTAKDIQLLSNDDKSIEKTHTANLKKVKHKNLIEYQKTLKQANKYYKYKKNVL